MVTGVPSCPWDCVAGFDVAEPGLGTAEIGRDPPFEPAPGAAETLPIVDPGRGVPTPGFGVLDGRAGAWSGWG